MFPLRLSGDFERPRWKPEETVSRDLAATAAGLEVLCHIQGNGYRGIQQTCTGCNSNADNARNKLEDYWL